MDVTELHILIISNSKSLTLGMRAERLSHRSDLHLDAAINHCCLLLLFHT